MKPIKPLKQLYTAIIIICISTTSVKAQISISGIVYDNHFKSPIPYVNVGIENTTIGELTNTDGYFTIVIPQDHKSSSLTFHLPGYARKDVLISSLVNESIEVYLEEFGVELGEVVVDRQKLKTKSVTINDKIGNTNVALSQTVAGGAAIAQYFNTELSEFWLEKVKLKIYENLEDSIKVRVRLLEVLPDQSPGKDITDVNMIVNAAIKEGWWDMDLSDYYLPLNSPEFFLCFELLEDLEVRKAQEAKRQLKAKMMYDLYDKGVKEVTIRTKVVDGKEERIGWSSRLNDKKAAEFGVNFPTSNVTLVVSKDSKRPTYTRLSSFGSWRPLFNGRISLASGVEVSYER